jgi:hypothetical protein
MRTTSSAFNVRARPGRGASRSMPLMPDSRNRFRHRVAAGIRERPVSTVFPRQSKLVILEEWEVREARKY